MQKPKKKNFIIGKKKKKKKKKFFLKNNHFFFFFFFFKILNSFFLASAFSATVIIPSATSETWVKHRVCSPSPKSSREYCPDRIFLTRSGITCAYPGSFWGYSLIP